MLPLLLPSVVVIAVVAVVTVVVTVSYPIARVSGATAVDDGEVLAVAALFSVRYRGVNAGLPR